MRNIVAVSITVLLLVCALYSVSFFTKITVSEYTLHRATDLFGKVTSNPQLTSRRQQQLLITAVINDLETVPATAVNIERIYQLRAKLLYALSAYEVWPAKREKYLKQAIYNNYNAININHYNMQSWLLELQIQDTLNDQEKNLLWPLANVLVLGEWNYDVMRYASFYCVLKWKKMPTALKQKCSDTLKKLWSNDVEQRKVLNQLRGIYNFEAIVEEMRQ